MMACCASAEPEPMSSAHQINPEKLALSKWTAVAPLNREKHFMVTSVVRDEAERVCGCILEAVMTRREQQVDWRVLKDATRWQPGWR